MFAKQKVDKKIIHFINFYDATTLEWRDTNANQAEPQNSSSYEESIPLTTYVPLVLSGLLQMRKLRCLLVKYQVY